MKFPELRITRKKIINNNFIEVDEEDLMLPLSGEIYFDKGLGVRRRIDVNKEYNRGICLKTKDDTSIYFYITTNADGDEYLIATKREAKKGWEHK